MVSTEVLGVLYLGLYPSLRRSNAIVRGSHFLFTFVDHTSAGLQASWNLIDSRVFLFWIRSTVPLFTRLSRNVLREVSTYLKSFGLAYVTQNTIGLFTSESEEIINEVSLQKEIQCDSNSRWALVDDARFFICGGGTPRSAFRAAYMLNRAGAVQVLPTMLQGHTLCGVIRWRSTVHVFGSVGLCQSEQFSMNAKVWTGLPSMHHAKWGFNPSIWQSAIYLCQATIEVYDGENMLDLGVDLPDSGFTLTYILHNSLYILSNCFLTIRNRAGEQVSLEHALSPVYFSYSSPILNYGKVVIFDSTRKVLKFDAESGEMISS